MSNIKFYREDENRVVIETEDRENSIFAEQYNKAFAVFDKLLERKYANASRRGSGIESPSIVAFCGDRGEGKSSCMESVVRMLEENVVNWVEYKQLVFLDTLDPAFFDEDHNLIELILGQMFRRYQAMVEDNECLIDSDEAIELRKAFHDAKVCLTQIYKSKEVIYDPLEEIDALSAGLSLHHYMEILVDKYLDFVIKHDCRYKCTTEEGGNISKKKLIICIDDLDLNIHGADTMVEQIRKYLSIPNCIIFLSLNVDQLIDVIKNSIKKREAVGSSLKVQEMATKYVTKLLPLDCRVVMPKIYDICNRGMVLYNSRDDERPQEEPSIKEGLLRIVYNKTRYLFYNSNGGISPLVPNNLRSLRHLMGMLLSMPDYDREDGSISNKTAFKAYFFNVWTKQLNHDNQKFAELLAKDTDPTAINKIVVRYLASYEGIKETNNELLNSIIDPHNYSYNVSLGDVLYFVDYLERSNADDELTKLLFFIKSFYSIKLYDYYDIITVDKNKIDDGSGDTGEIFKHEAWLKGTNIIQRFVNGSFFTYDSGELLPIKKVKSNPFYRDLRILDIKKQVNPDMAQYIKDAVKRFDNIDEEEKNKFKRLFRTMEFIALTTKTSIRQKEMKFDGNIRRDLPTPFHLTTFNPNTKYYVIDLLAPFTNVLNLHYCYDRFEHLRLVGDGTESFYSFALKSDWSLLNRMTYAVRRKEYNEETGVEPAIEDLQMIPKEYFHKDNPLWRLISNATIRNSEVQSSIMETMHSLRNTYGGMDEHRFVMSFYRTIINSEMRTYTNIVEGRPYVMRFAFLQALIDEINGNEYIKTLLSPVNEQPITKEDIPNLFPALFTGTWQKKKNHLALEILNGAYPDLMNNLSSDKWEDRFPNNRNGYMREEYIDFLFANYTEMIGSEGMNDGEEDA